MRWLSNGGGGVCFTSDDANAVFENNLIAFNRENNTSSDFGIAGNSSAAVTNCAAAAVGNCLFEDHCAVGTDPVARSPRFVGPIDSALGDFTLKAGWSNPGYKAGRYAEWMASAVDLYGGARILHVGQI